MNLKGCIVFLASLTPGGASSCETSTHFDISKEKSKIHVSAEAPFSKRYLKSPRGVLKTPTIDTRLDVF